MIFKLHKIQIYCFIHYCQKTNTWYHVFWAVQHCKVSLCLIEFLICRLPLPSNYTDSAEFELRKPAYTKSGSSKETNEAFNTTYCYGMKFNFASLFLGLIIFVPLRLCCDCNIKQQKYSHVEV